MSIISNQAVEVQESAFKSFDNGIAFSTAFAQYTNTVFEHVWLLAWKEKESKYEAEYSEWLDNCNNKYWNDKSDAADAADAADSMERVL